MTFRDHVRRLNEEYHLEVGVALPAPVAGVAASPLQASCDAWFDKIDQQRTHDKVAKALSDKAFRNRLAPVRKAIQLEKAAIRKRGARKAAADALGVPVRRRADCSGMTETQKEEHRREVGRLAKQRQRGAKESPEVLPVEEMDLWVPPAHFWLF